MIKYQARITAIGPLVSEFVDAGILVFFGQTAPPELAEFSILHDGVRLEGTVSPGDQFCFDDHRYRVLAVGEVANKNLDMLGHLVVKFTGATMAQLPGDVCVEAAPLPKLALGMSFRIEGGDGDTRAN
ncbi:MAG TPA: PTS glucitol/sorbitol transporter subunit IIA [bacterium]|nr:PTS glucitol/sorbitol transporter subunit IIA [bacterium]